LGINSFLDSANPPLLGGIVFAAKAVGDRLSRDFSFLFSFAPQFHPQRRAPRETEYFRGKSNEKS
jgi:hypothetical protein